jgi:hypothetical protein
MRGRGLRFITALVVVGICALAMYRGSDIVRFGVADAGLGPEGKTADADRPWVNVPGLAFSAHESLLKGEGDSGDLKGAEKQREELKDILAVRPLSSEDWLALSEMRLVAGEPIGKVAEAFSLSVLTGTDEDLAMSRRGVFGLVHWEALPGDIRQRAAADLVAVLGAVKNSDILRAALYEKTEKFRQDIRTALQAEGISAAQLAAIGL